jgi:hypothetical protein
MCLQVPGELDLHPMPMLGSVLPHHQTYRAGVMYWMFGEQTMLKFWLPLPERLTEPEFFRIILGMEEGVLLEPKATINFP